MAATDGQRRGVRQCARSVSQRLHGRERRRRRLQRGQSLIIFAMTLTVLMALAGLAIDVVRVFDLYARMQRAAEAGALAGVLYMPTNYNTAQPAPGDGKSATSRAVEETIKNGFGAPVAPNANLCPATPGTVIVAVCPVPGKVNDLRVTITSSINLVLLGLLGFGPTQVTASAQAEYLPPIQIGSRQAYFGNQVECVPTETNPNPACTPSANRQHLQSFLATFNGPADIKESGDPMVYCAEGPDVINGTDPTSGPNAYNGYPTNHPQWPGVVSGYTPITRYCGKPTIGVQPNGNPTYQPEGFDGPATRGTAHPGGYNYQVRVGTGVSGASLWVFNANYVPTDYRTPLPYDVFIDYPGAFYQGPRGEGLRPGNDFDGYHRDAPLFYYTTTISVYRVNSLYDRSQDTLVSTTAYAPYDNTYYDLQFHGCPSGTVYNPIWQGQNTPNFYHNPSDVIPGQGCVPPPTCAAAWCKLSIAGGLGTGTYRVVVEATGLDAITTDYQSSSLDGYGSHTYALKLCDSNAVVTPLGCGNAGGGVGMAGWNNMDVIFQAPLQSTAPSPTNPSTSCAQNNATPYTCMDLGCIPTAYAGRSVSLSLYDVGDGTNTLYVGIARPPGSTATVQYPSYVSPLLTTVNGVQSVQTRNTSGYRPLNGLTLDATLVLPPNYVGDCTANGSGWWQLMYASSDSGQPTDKVGVRFSLVGSPVHLVALG